MRATLLLVFIQSPHRFRTKRSSGLLRPGIETRDAVSIASRQGPTGTQRQPTVMGLNRNHHHLLKYVLKKLAAPLLLRLWASTRLCSNSADQGMRPEMSGLTVARKIAASSGLWTERSQLKRPLSETTSSLSVG